MIRPAVVVLLLLSGCIDPTILPDGVSCEQRAIVQQSAPGPALDLVFVISDAPSMAPYRDRLLEQLEAFGTTLSWAGASLHVAMVDAGGLTIGDGCAPETEDPFYADLYRPWWMCGLPMSACRERNFEGELSELLPCAAPVENPVSAPSLIQEVTNALTRDDTGFVRRDAPLGIVVISAVDDGSAQPVGVYLDRIRTSRADPTKIWATTVTRGSAPRLAQLRDAFPTPSPPDQDIELDEEDWGWAVANALVKTDLAISCLDPETSVDLDPEATGVQGDCIGSDHGAALPYCRMLSPELPDPDVLPCYWLQVNPVGAFECTRPVVERLQWAQGHDGEAELRCACAL